MAGIGARKPIKLINETPSISGRNWAASSETILRTWADVRSTSGFRTSTNGQAELGRLFEFKFRYQGDIEINANTRLVYDGQRYAIHTCEKDKQKQFYWIVRCQAKSFN